MSYCGKTLNSKWWYSSVQLNHKNRMCHTLAQYIYIYIYWLIILCLSPSPSLYILLSLSFSRSRTSMRNAFCLSVCISLLFILNLFYGCFSTLALKQQYHEYIDFRSIAFQSNETVLSIIFTMQNHQRQNFWMNLHKYRLVLLFILYV